MRNEGEGHGNQQCANDSVDAFGLCYLDQFYSAANSHQTKLAIGSAYKGFDNTHAGWLQDPTTGVNPNPSIYRQDCGQTWLNTFAQINHYYSSTNQLRFLQVMTWNDYDEGHEAESGIDNCYQLAATIANGQLQWSLSVRSNAEPGASSYVTEATIDHYEVSENSNLLATVPSGTHAVSLSSLNLSSGTHNLFVKAIGIPMIVNQPAPYVTYTAP